MPELSVHESVQSEGQERHGALATELPAREIHRSVDDRSVCDFYHTMEFPGGFVPDAQWDLRRHVDDYLGRVNFAGKRVLEIGPASGFLSLHMERCGAQVTCIEPPVETIWDFVPRADMDMAAVKRRFSEHIARVRNSFWYAHQAFDSRVRLFEADSYQIPSSLGPFDIGVLGSILLHCKSPVGLIEAVAKRVEHTVIVTERYVRGLGNRPVCRLVPTAKNGVWDTWWQFSPRFFEQFFAVLGFPYTTVSWHKQYFCPRKAWLKMFTAVATRNR